MLNTGGRLTDGRKLPEQELAIYRAVQDGGAIKESIVQEAKWLQLISINTKNLNASGRHHCITYAFATRRK